jgi:beta-lactamase regulating signal transducer with metallopeptidase domain
MYGLLRFYPGDSFVQAAASVLVQSTAVLLLALIVSRLFLRGRAALRYAVWLCALVCILLSPFAAVTGSYAGSGLVELPPPQVRDWRDTRLVGLPEHAATQQEHSGTPESGVANPAAVSERSENPQQIPRAAAQTDATRTVLAGLFLVWAVGALFMLVKLIFGFGVHAALRRAVQPLDDEDFEPVLEQVRRIIGVERLAPVVTSSAINSPVSIGIRNPLVILPQYLPYALTPEEFRNVLVHEYAHIYQRDHVIALLQRVAAILLWPHPLLLSLNRGLAVAREEVCDNYVLRDSQAPSYARTLLGLAEKTTIFHRSPASVGLAHPRWKLEERVAGILDAGRNLLTGTGAAAFSAIATIFLAAVITTSACRVVSAAPPAGESAMLSVAQVRELVGELESGDSAAKDAVAGKLIAAGTSAAAEVEKLLDSPDEAARARAQQILDALHYVTRTDGEKLEREIDLCIKAAVSSEEDGENQLRKSLEAMEDMGSAPYYLVGVLAGRGETKREEFIARLLAGALDLPAGDAEIDTIILGSATGKKAFRVTSGKNGEPMIIEPEELPLLKGELTPAKVLCLVAVDSALDRDIRVRAVEALAARGAAQAVAILVKMLEKSEGAMLLEVAEALRRLTGQPFGPAAGASIEEIEESLNNWNSWWEKNRKQAGYRFDD